MGAKAIFPECSDWWGAFSIPILLRVPEPPAAPGRIVQGLGVITASFQRLSETIKDIRRYRELFKYLLAFLIYNDESDNHRRRRNLRRRNGLWECRADPCPAAVQFVGIPFSLIFGRLPTQATSAGLSIWPLCCSTWLPCP